MRWIWGSRKIEHQPKKPINQYLGGSWGATLKKCVCWLYLGDSLEKLGIFCNMVLSKIKKGSKGVVALRTPKKRNKNPREPSAALAGRQACWLGSTTEVGPGLDVIPLFLDECSIKTPGFFGIFPFPIAMFDHQRILLQLFRFMVAKVIGTLPWLIAEGYLCVRSGGANG